MSEFFGSIYCWLEDFFGIELAEYLWGESSPEQLSNNPLAELIQCVLNSP